ncbi:MAG: hypothetical protein GX891_05405, partial [Clostridiales bacterium]|nr:hypothetical protein [Clostridiales bacterium]
MLGDKNSKILDVIIDFCGSGEEFKILDAEDILSKLPAELAMDKDTLAAAIKEL